AWLCLVAATASANDYTVTKTADTNDGVCAADCSLREAIAAANANVGADRVILGTAQAYGLSLGQLNVTDSLTIDGNQSAIDGNNLSRVLSVSGPISVALNYVTIKRGLASGFLAHGGGILVRN